MKKLSCKEARQIDLVEYLASLGYQPKKIRNQDYWYISPFRDERTASFKVNKTKNVWFDFGEGQGGDIIDFGVRYFKCSISELLERLSDKSSSLNFSFHPPLIAGEKKEPGGRIMILNERPIAALPLLNYLKKRCIPVEIAKQFCREIDFELYGKKYTAIGFQNDKGGYELRNKDFKGSSSPKAISFFDKKSDALTVFEGFFDFLSYQALNKESSNETTNALVLNSLSFFHLAKEVMDKHHRVNLYLDRNAQGIKYTREALKWDKGKYQDFSKSFRSGQDLNDWLIEREFKDDSKHLIKKIQHHQSRGRRI